MTTIYVASTTPATKTKKIKQFLEDEAPHDPQWNGAVFKIEVDECTLTEEESARAIQLLNVVQEYRDIIMGYQPN